MLKDLWKRIQPSGASLSFFLWAMLIPAWNPPSISASVTDGAMAVVLDNGFTVVLKEDHSAPVASIQVWVRTGSANETPEEAGITHMIEHMLFKGTPSRQTGEIARTIENAGGHINAYTTFDRTVYYVEIDSAHFQTGLEVLLDALQNSLFDPEELEREREVVLEEYRRSLDLPDTQLRWATMGMAYGVHPYGRPIIGHEETIQAFDREGILEYMNKWYTPQNTVLVAVGDFDARKALEQIKTLVEAFPERKGAKEDRPREPKQTEIRTTLLKKDVQQVYLNLCWHIPALSHPDIYSLDVLEMILGRGNSSRLYERLKMQTQLVYRVAAGAYALADPGLFSVQATLAPENLENALRAIGDEINRIRKHPVSRAEMDKARTMLESDFVFGMENMSGQARTLGFFQTMTGDLENANRYLEEIRKVTTQDVTRVVQTYLTPDNMTVGLLVPEGTKGHLKQEDFKTFFQPCQEPAPSPPEKKADGEPRLIHLSNGMRLILKENHGIPAVSFAAVLLGGTRFEPEGEWGISGFTARMLTRGTTRRSASQIASEVASLGATLDGFSGRNSLGVSGRFLSKDIHAGLGILADVLLNSRFPEEEVEKVRDDLLAQIRAKKDRPTGQLFDLFYETLYENHPYGHPQTGTEETIGRIDRSRLKDWYRSVAIPSNLVLAVVGDLDPDALVPQIESLFKDLVPADKELPQIAAEPPIQRPREAHLTRPGAQTHLMVGYLGVGIKSREHAAMSLVNAALSGQGGRLFSRLRDQQSLAYAVMAFRSPGLETGAFGVYLACDPSKLEAAKEGIFGELSLLREKGLDAKELEDARQYFLGNLRIGLQTNGSQAMQMALDELYGLGYNHNPEFVRQVEAVTLEDATRAIQDVIAPEGYVVVTVGPDL